MVSVKNKNEQESEKYFLLLKDRKTKGHGLLVPHDVKKEFTRTKKKIRKFTYYPGRDHNFGG
jgi:hypothetical protein